MEFSLPEVGKALRETDGGRGEVDGGRGEVAAPV